VTFSSPAARGSLLLRLSLATRLHHISKLMLLAVPFLMGTSAFADDDRLVKANQNREAAQARAQGQLGYPYVFRESRDRQVDFLSLAAQITALSHLMDQLAASQNEPTISTPPEVPINAGLRRSRAGALTKEAYGPDGPTIKSVRLIAEYQLIRNGNKRLKLGEIKDQTDSLILDIVTQDGSLVERYKIVKETGDWLPVEDP
jgi:hypothetical protein